MLSRGNSLAEPRCIVIVIIIIILIIMTIILFLIDSSASMAQKTYLGTTMLDIARSIVELFLKVGFFSFFS